MKIKKISLLLISLLISLSFVVTSCSCNDDNEDDTHVCEHVCVQCGLCTDVACTDSVCSQKCQCNGHKCSHVCPLCVKCTDPTCTDKKCVNKCEGHNDFVDIAGQATLDLTENSTSKKLLNANVRVVSGKAIGYIDGDTTHFTWDDAPDQSGVLKARYLAVDTPESTGKIEQYGKKASDYTKNALMSAESIVLESDNENWNVDSTGGRYLVWVWYRTSSTSPYRCLNIELLQRGLAIASKSANNKYGTYCIAAINQAKELQFNVHSGITDPDYYQGNAIPVTIKELRANPTAYVNKNVSVEGIVAYTEGQSAYIESYDSETNLYLGVTVYLGYSASGNLITIFTMGNKVRVVGSFQKYEAGGSYQISGLQYSNRKTGPNYCGLISTNNTSSFQKISVSDFKTGTRNITYIDTTGEEKSTTINVCDLIASATVTIENVTVTYVTTTTTGNSAGAMTLTCKDASNVSMTIRTDVLEKSDHSLVVKNDFYGKTITVKGVVDYYNGAQVKVFSYDSVTFLD